MDKITAIFTGDIHIQSVSPISRKDNYLNSLGKKLKWLEGLRKKYDCPILDAGDLLSKWQLNPELEQWCIQHIPNEFHTIIGNHDMPNHNINLFKKGSLSLLNAVGSVKVIQNSMGSLGWEAYSKHYGGISSDVVDKTKRNILITHEMICQNKQSHDHFAYSTAKNLLKKHKNFDLILSGHNHESFEHEYEGRKLINIGSLMRRDVAQKGYKPRVVLWSAKTNETKWINVPLEDENIISSEHLDKIRLKKTGIESYVDSLKDLEHLGLSFEKNVESFFIANNTREEVKNKIREFFDK